MALVELSVVEQRYRAVLDAAAGVPVTEVAERYGVSRQSVHAWIRRYEQGGGLGGLMDRSRRPESCPHQVSVEVEAAVCELRREHPRWGPLRLAHELGRAGVMPVPSRMSVYRVLVRHGLIEPQPRKRPKDSYVRWERDAPMALWQMDLVGGIFLGDGTEAKLVTGVDDHSRFCVICQVVVRATGRAVCLAFAAALRQFGVPGEVLTDNGKQFTDRFGKGGEVLFDRICRDNGIVHRLTQPRHPTTTGKIERFHGSLRRELLDDAVPFTDLVTAQAAIDGWVSEYNTTRPHQGIGMAAPAQRFSTAAARAEEDLLPLRLPAVIALAPAPEPGPGRRRGSSSLAGRPGGVRPARPAEREHGGPGQAVLARHHTFGDDRHLLGQRRRHPPEHRQRAGQVGPIPSVHRRSGAAGGQRRLGSRAAPIPAAQPGSAIEVDRVVSKDGAVSLGGRYHIAAEILGGMLVSIRIEENTLMFFDPETRVLLRTRPSPLTWDQARLLRGARPAGPPPRPSAEPVTVQRRASNTGIIMVVGQKIALGRIHAGRTVTVHVAEDTMTIDLGGEDVRTIRRNTTQPVRSIKAHRPRKAAHVS